MWVATASTGFPGVKVEQRHERRQPHAGVNDEVEIAAFEVIEIRPEVVVQERFGKCDEVRSNCPIWRGSREP